MDCRSGIRLRLDECSSWENYYSFTHKIHHLSTVQTTERGGPASLIFGKQTLLN